MGDLVATQFQLGILSLPALPPKINKIHPQRGSASSDGPGRKAE
jgi:hypothetical protein